MHWLDATEWDSRRISPDPCTLHVRSNTAFVSSDEHLKKTTLVSLVPRLPEHGSLGTRLHIGHSVVYINFFKFCPETATASLDYNFLLYKTIDQNQASQSW